MTPLTLCARSGDLHNPFLGRALGYYFGLSRPHAAAVTDKQLSQERRFSRCSSWQSVFQSQFLLKWPKQLSPLAPVLGQVPWEGNPLWFAELFAMLR
jgi:hypothetical protein